MELFPKTAKLSKGELKAQLIFWNINQGFNESSENITQTKKNISYIVWNENKIIPDILDELMIGWTPVINKTIEFNKGSGKKTNLIFLGINGPKEEQKVEKTHKARC